MIHQTQNFNFISLKINMSPLNKDKTKILIVEDNKINQKLLILNLRSLGYTEITIAETGEEALSLFSSDFNLIFLDVGLPGISGIDVAKKMRNLMQNKEQIIILCTALSQNVCIDLEKGSINAYLQKPYSIEDLKNILTDYSDNI